MSIEVQGEDAIQSDATASGLQTEKTLPQSQGGQRSVSKDAGEGKSDAVSQVFVAQPGEKQHSRVPETKGNYLKDSKENVQGEQRSVSKDDGEDRSDAVPQAFVVQPGEEQHSRAPSTKGIYLKDLRENVFFESFL